MADRYVTIFFDWPEVTGELNAQEKGRLIDAIVLYARGGDWQEQIKGNERYLFPAFRQQIDRANNISGKRAEAGAAGGKQTEANRSKTQQTQAKPSKRKQTEAKPSKTPNEYNNEYEYKEEYEYTTPYNPPQGEPVAVVAYAAQILPHLTPNQVQELTSYREDLPDDLITHALDIAADNTRTWAYVKGILNRYLDEGVRTLADAEAQEARRRQQKRNGVGPAGAKEPNPATDYQQREYKAEDFSDDYYIDLSKYAKEGTA